MSDFKNINLLMKKYNIKPNKKYGQNFLVDNIIISQIVDFVIKDGCEIIEIGPGLGSLTFPLLKKVKSLIAYEIDENMINFLSKEINDPKFILNSQNFLNAKFMWKNKKNIIGNIPYNITSEIIFKILKNLDKFSSATIMVQKEVGERIMANTNTKNYGKLSITLQSVAKIKKVVNVNKCCFFPQPKVDSIIINMLFNKKPNYEYFDFISKCFLFRRKTFYNNLKQFLNISQINKIFEKFDLKSNIRAQEINIQKFEEIFNFIT